MKKILIIIILLIVACGQVQEYPYNTGTIHIGDSITFLCGQEYPEYFIDKDNFSIPGAGAEIIIDIVRALPYTYSNINIMIGINDVPIIDVSTYSDNIRHIITSVSTETRITFYSLLPTILYNEYDILNFNNKLKEVINYYDNATYVDIHNLFLNEYGVMNSSLYMDDIHLNREGCKLLFN